jgi:hypothetical protein
MSLSFTIQILRQFDGTYNYFNPSHYNGKTIFRRESKFNNQILVSDIVDDQNNIILEHHTDTIALYCYEDARFINENEISVCVCRRNIEDLDRIFEVSYKKYDLNTKQFTHYKTQNAHFEKHWQFYEDKIIYHVNPYTVMDKDESVLFTYDIDWNPWIEKYGNPGLSTNVFEVDCRKYLLFHSYRCLNGVNLRYYVGVLELNNDLTPIGYFNDPLFGSIESYDVQTFVNYFNWKRSLKTFPTVVDAIFAMSTVVYADKIDFYCGISDCNAAKLATTTENFKNWCESSLFIAVNFQKT